MRTVDGLEGKRKGVGEINRVVIFLGAYDLLSVRIGWFLGLDKASLRLVIGFIMRQCRIASLTSIWNRSQSDYCRLYWDEEELEPIGHHICNSSALSRLKTHARGFFEILYSVSKADINALHKLITSLSWLRSTRASTDMLSCVFFLACVIYLFPYSPSFCLSLQVHI